MKSSQTTTKVIVFLVLLAVGLGYLGYSFAAVERTPDRREYADRTPGREYEVAVPPYKSDTVRMVEAYERLSDQYLGLVQHSLASMDANDRLLLQKLEAMDRKLDELTKKVDALSAPKPAETPPAESKP